MTEIEQKSIRTLIVEREEIAFKRLNNNLRYLEICKRQNETGNIVDELHHQRFTHEERIRIRRHYEGETEKEGMEVYEVYLQGLKDCFHLIIRLGLLTD